MIDTHAHLNFSAFKDDADEVLRRSLDAGMKIINVGSQYATSRRAVEMAEKYPDGVYAAIGLHPIHAGEEEFSYEKYKELAKLKKVVAIGEVGLDYFHKPYDRERQRIVLCQQLDLAKELSFPVIFHCRNAHEDLIKILQAASYKLQAVIHCFTGNWQEARDYLGMGFYLGFNGIIFKADLDEVIKKTPLDKILLETDCPYLTPLPAAALLARRSISEGGAKAGPQPIRNEPLYIKYVAQKIAGLKDETFEKISEVTDQNAEKLFGIQASI